MYGKHRHKEVSTMPGAYELTVMLYFPYSIAVNEHASLFDRFESFYSNYLRSE